MYCRNCKYLMDPKAAICVRCGVPAGQGTLYCYNCGADTKPNDIFCRSCGVGLAKTNKSEKSKLAAGLLGIFLGGLGIHNFYLGYTKKAVIQIIVSLVTFGIGGIWGFIEGILILCGSVITTDANGLPLE